MVTEFEIIVNPGNLKGEIELNVFELKFHVRIFRPVGRIEKFNSF